MSEREKLPQVDFSSVAISLAMGAMVQLGAAPDPETGKTAEPNLALARQSIDTLEMLREKTRGNLEPDEVKLLDGLLYELRMRAVEVERARGGGAGPAAS